MWRFIKRLFMPDPFVSKVDQFLQDFDHKHPEPSASQRREQDKYSNIYYLRDHVNRSQEKK